MNNQMTDLNHGCVLCNDSSVYLYNSSGKKHFIKIYTDLTIEELVRYHKLHALLGSKICNFSISELINFIKQNFDNPVVKNNLLKLEQQEQFLIVKDLSQFIESQTGLNASKKKVKAEITNLNGCLELLEKLIANIYGVEHFEYKILPLDYEKIYPCSELSSQKSGYVTSPEYIEFLELNETYKTYKQDIKNRENLEKYIREELFETIAKNAKDYNDLVHRFVIGEFGGGRQGLIDNLTLEFAKQFYITNFGVDILCDFNGNINSKGRLINIYGKPTLQTIITDLGCDITTFLQKTKTIKLD